MTRFARWIKFLALPFILAMDLTAGGASAASAASAGTGAQWDANNTGNYANAWGGLSGSRQINTYRGQTANNDFEDVLDPGSGYINLEFSGVLVIGGACIADFGNSSTSARAGLYDCSNGTPWGANFRETSCTAGGHFGEEFYDVHWKGWLGPSGSSNGDAWYLNKPAPYCLAEYPPA
jgi:hypothetical protein